MPASLIGPADRPFSMAFTNEDALPHNVAIATGGGAERFQGRIFNGVQTVIYAIPSLPAGDYRLSCTVHPAMTGSLALR